MLIRNRTNMYQRTFIRLCCVLFLLALSSKALANEIECVFDVNDEKKQLVIYPHNDIYRSSKINLPGGFRFAGQYLPELKKFKAYIYHTPNTRYVLLALQEFSISERNCSQDFGQHRVYDSSDERELYFHCKIKCAN